MPGFDKTGPVGMGSRTGKGFGSCGLGLGWRNRFGADRGIGKYFTCWNWPQTKENQKKSLANYRKALEEELEDVRKEEIELSQEK